MLNVKASDECLAAFEKVKLKKKHAYIIFYIKHKEGTIEVEKEVLKADVGEEEEYAAEFIAALKESGTCRYGALDYNKQLLFVSWSPDTGKPKDKMTYAAAKEEFANSLQGIKSKIQATDESELNLDKIKEACKSNV